MIKTMIRSISIYHEGESPIFGELTTTVSLDDEAGGMFLVIEGKEGQRVCLDPEEIDHVFNAAKSLFAQAGVE
ncbi:hypothetical protein FQZ97_1096330 [compost metagenome]